MAKHGYKNRIRVVLADRNVTNRALADKMGVSEMTVSRWVTNRFQPSMSQFVEISILLNVDIKELIEVDPIEISGIVDEPRIGYGSKSLPCHSRAAGRSYRSGI